jgi:hypothetical protein
MINKQFHNDTDQRTRRQVLDNERKVQRENDTYHSRAQASVGEELGGRFKRYTPYSVAPVPQYPRIASGPWAANEGGTEMEPFPVDINAVDIGYPPTASFTPAAVDGEAAAAEPAGVVDAAAADPSPDPSGPARSPAGQLASPVAVAPIGTCEAPSSTKSRRI